MGIDILYKSICGRAFVIFCEKIGIFRLINRFLKTKMSRRLIPRYIAKHQIDMSEFEGQEYQSFADFFARKRKNVSYFLNHNILISPCDSMLSIYSITESMHLWIKGSCYRLEDLIPDPTIADQFADGLCMVFRLEASDYHYFCAFDDMMVKETHFIPGRLHSVQPIVCEKIPVYRFNRRWWSFLDTVHFGKVLQIEIGAMLVGDVHFQKMQGGLYRGEDMGNFELAGSTILLLFTSEIKQSLKIDKEYDANEEHPVVMGTKIGILERTDFMADDLSCII